ncbi:MAG: VOC family protein, partial [Qingshengfaniella sp.]
PFMPDDNEMQARFVTVRVENWHEAINFYRNILGLTLKFSDDENQFAMFESGLIRIAVEGSVKPAHKRQNDTGALLVNFNVKNLQKTLENLRESGAQILSNIKQGPGYSYVAISDPEGNEHILFENHEKQTDAIAVE